MQNRLRSLADWNFMLSQAWLFGASQIASLQASALGQPLYEKMGFADAGSYLCFGPRA